MPFALDSLLQLIVTYKGEGGGELERHNLSGFFIARAPPQAYLLDPPGAPAPRFARRRRFVMLLSLVDAHGAEEGGEVR